MYEGITYAELKSLPREQKADAWRELKSLYSTQRELAEKLGVSPAVVYNIISRYAKDKPEESNNGPLELVDPPDGRRAGARKRKAREMGNIIKNIENEAFSIGIRKLATGEDAQYLLAGIGNTLLKNRNYMIEVTITEN